MHRLKLYFILLLVLLGGVFVVAQPVLAHAVPEASTPAPNEILTESPSEIVIEFNEPVVPTFSRISVLTQAGDEVAVGELTAVSAENRALSVTLPELHDGAYLVSWQVLSAVDGHTTSGTYSFGVGIEALSTVANEVTISAQISYLSATARWLTLLGVVLLMGIFAFRLIVWNPIWRKVEMETADEAIDLRLGQISIKVGYAALGAIAMALILIFIDQNRTFDLISGGNLGTWLSTQFGAMWALRLFIILAMQFYFSLIMNVQEQKGLRGWTWWAGLLITAVLAISVSMVSHAAAVPADTNQVILVDFVHVMAATLWAGGLIFLAISLWVARPLQAESKTWLNLSLVLNFSGLAAIAVGMLLVSGGYLAWTHIGTWTNLVGTAYGLVLLAKLGVVTLTFLMAGVNLIYIKPRLDKAYENLEDPKSETAVSRFRKVVIVEVTLAIIVIVITGFLTDLQRGIDAPLLTDAPGQTTVTQQVDDLNIQLTLSPALVGQNTFDIFITDENGDPVTDIEEASLRFTFLGQSIGSASADTEKIEDGYFQAEGSYISLIGTWQVEVAIQRPGVFDTFAAYRLEAGVGGNIRPAEVGANPLEQFAKFMTLAGGGGTGTLLVIFAILWGVIAVKAAKNEFQLVPLLLISLFAFWLGSSQLITFFNEDYTPAKFANNPILPDVESIAIGKGIFDENCAACHGEKGRGNGPASLSLNPPPADFAAGHTETHPDGDLYYWILEGVADTQMPAFQDLLTDEEAWHLVNYVRRLSAQGQADDQG